MPFGAIRRISSAVIRGLTSKLKTPLSRTRRAINCAVWLPKSRMRTVSVPGGGSSTMGKGRNVAPARALRLKPATWREGGPSRSSSASPLCAVTNAHDLVQMRSLAHCGCSLGCRFAQTLRLCGARREWLIIRKSLRNGRSAAREPVALGRCRLANDTMEGTGKSRCR